MVIHPHHRDEFPFFCVEAAFVKTAGARISSQPRMCDSPAIPTVRVEYHGALVPTTRSLSPSPKPFAGLQALSPWRWAHGDRTLPSSTNTPNTIHLTPAVLTPSLEGVNEKPAPLKTRQNPAVPHCPCRRGKQAGQSSTCVLSANRRSGAYEPPLLFEHCMIAVIHTCPLSLEQRFFLVCPTLLISGVFWYVCFVLCIRT